MPDQIIMARKEIALDLEFEKAMNYHNEGYESNNDYGLPPHYEAYLCLFNLHNRGLLWLRWIHHNPVPNLTLHSRHPRSLPFWEGVCQCLAFEEIAPLTEEDSEDEDPPTADPVWSKEPVLDSKEYLYIHKIPRPATPPNQPSPQPIAATSPL